MSIAIDHVGIPAADPWASAWFLREILAEGEINTRGARRRDGHPLAADLDRLSAALSRPPGYPSRGPATPRRQQRQAKAFDF